MFLDVMFGFAQHLTSTWVALFLVLVVLAAGIAAAHGLELFDVTFGREGGGFVLRVVLDQVRWSIVRQRRRPHAGQGGWGERLTRVPCRRRCESARRR